MTAWSTPRSSASRRSSLLGAVGCKAARQQQIDRDPVAGHLACKRLGPASQRRAQGIGSGETGIGSRTLVDDTMMMRPHPFCRMAGRQHAATRIRLTTIASNWTRQADGSTSAAWNGGGPPPLSRRMSGPPRISPICDSSSCTPASVARSADIAAPPRHSRRSCGGCTQGGFVTPDQRHRRATLRKRDSHAQSKTLAAAKHQARSCPSVRCPSPFPSPRSSPHMHDRVDLDRHVCRQAGHAQRRARMFSACTEHSSERTPTRRCRLARRRRNPEPR